MPFRLYINLEGPYLVLNDLWRFMHPEHAFLQVQAPWT